MPERISKLARATISDIRIEEVVHAMDILRATIGDIHAEELGNAMCCLHAACATATGRRLLDIIDALTVVTRSCSESEESD
jgi:hypothetical protein